MKYRWKAASYRSEDRFSVRMAIIWIGAILPVCPNSLIWEGRFVPPPPFPPHFATRFVLRPYSCRFNPVLRVGAKQQDVFPEPPSVISNAFLWGFHVCVGGFVWNLCLRWIFVLNINGRVCRSFLCVWVGLILRFVIAEWVNLSIERMNWVFGEMKYNSSYVISIWFDLIKFIWRDECLLWFGILRLYLN